MDTSLCPAQQPNSQQEVIFRSTSTVEGLKHHIIGHHWYAEGVATSLGTQIDIIHLLKTHEHNGRTVR